VKELRSFERSAENYRKREEEFQLVLYKAGV